MNIKMLPKCPRPLSPPRAPKIPSRFAIRQDDLLFEKLIGAGACGEVWLGTFLPKQLPVAIKKLYSTELNENDLITWSREIEIHATLQHQNLLSFIGYTSTYPYTIVTTYVPNGSLYDALHSERLQLTGTDKTKIAYSIACGMKYLHDRHIMHRDLKSPNILLDDEKLPKICDFGLSRTREFQSFLTRTVGTPQWMAPELVKGGEYDETVDVYAYGVVLWEMLTNSIPFEGMEAFQIVYALSSNPNPHQVPSDTPKALGGLISRCCSQKPEERPTFAEILTLFENQEIRYDKCDEKSINDLILSVNESRKPVHMYRARKASTPQNFKPRAPVPLPRNSGNTMVPSFSSTMMPSPSDGIPKARSENAEKMLALLSSEDTSDIEAGIDFFERNQDSVIVSALPFWEHVLRLMLNCSEELEMRVSHLIIQYAKIREVLATIKSVKHLNMFVQGKTLDLFLYVINFLPELVDEEFISQLQLMILRQDQNARYRSIVLLCKIYSLIKRSSIIESIISFFFTIAPKFANKPGGDLIFRQLFYNWIKDSADLNSPITNLITLYLESEIDENAIAAYHAFFVMKDAIENIKIEVVLSHLSRCEQLADCALDFMARVDPSKFQKDEIDLLLDCFDKYNNQKAILLLCRIASANPKIIYENKRWIKKRGTQAVALLPVMLIIGQSFPEIINRKSAPKFFCEILSFGDRDSFPAICWLFLRFKITPEIAAKFDECTILHLICQRFKNTKTPAGIVAGSRLISRLAAVRFSTSFGVMVQHLSRCAAEKQELAPECIKALAVLVKYDDLKKVFRLCQVASVVEKFADVESLKEPVRQILFELFQK